MIRSERHDHALRFVLLGLGVGVKPPCSGQWFDAGELDPLSSLASDAGLEKFVTPFALTPRLAAPSDAVIGGLAAFLNLTQSLDSGRGHGLNRKRTGHPYSLFLNE